MCLENGLHLLDAQVRHLGTDINYVVLENIYNELKDSVDFHFESAVTGVAKVDGGYEVQLGNESYTCTDCIISVGRSGSKWMESVCSSLDIPTKSNRVDIGVRVELPAEIFSHLTDELYESKIVYRTEKFEDLVRTFCMNPKGKVVNSVGAGDSMVAGFVAGYLQSRSYAQALRLGTACGSATAFSLGLATKEKIDELLAQL
mgnify:CR=1 FL=1